MLHNEFSGNLSLPVKLEAKEITTYGIINHTGYRLLQTSMVTHFRSIFDINLQTLKIPTRNNEATKGNPYDLTTTKAALTTAIKAEDHNAIHTLTQKLGIAYFFKAVQTKNNIDLQVAFNICTEILKKDYESAQDYLVIPYHLQVMTPEKIDHLKSIAETMHYLARIYYELKAYDYAELCYVVELQIRSGLLDHTQTHDYFLSRCSYYLGRTYSAMNQTPEAIQYYELAIKAQAQLDDSHWIIGRASYKLAKRLKALAITHLNLSELNSIALDQLTKAENYLMRAAQLLQNSIKIYEKSNSKEFQKRRILATIVLKHVEKERLKVAEKINQIQTGSTKTTEHKTEVDQEQQKNLRKTRVSQMGFLRCPSSRNKSHIVLENQTPHTSKKPN